MATLDNPTPTDPIERRPWNGRIPHPGRRRAERASSPIESTRPVAATARAMPIDLISIKSWTACRRSRRTQKPPRYRPKSPVSVRPQHGRAFAPIVAAETPVLGVAVYGTFIKTWPEYLAENSRRQSMLGGVNPVAFDTQARLLERFNHAMLIDKHSPEQILNEHPNSPPFDQTSDNEQLESVYGRHYTFFQQLYDQNLPTPGYAPHLALTCWLSGVWPNS